MAADDLSRLADGEEDLGLAAILVDQFAVLDDARPDAVKALVGAGAAVFTFDWPTLPADEIFLAGGRREALRAFRLAVLEVAAPILADAVEVELGRAVVSWHFDAADDLRQIAFRFELGARTATGRESIEGTRNWAAHLRRNARLQRAEYRRRRKELAGRREDLRRLVSELEP